MKIGAKVQIIHRKLYCQSISEKETPKALIEDLKDFQQNIDHYKQV